MQSKYYISFLLFAVVFMSGCAHQPITTSSRSEQKQIIQPKQIPEIIHKKKPLCTPNWECSIWSECIQSGKQTRTCNDKNNCGVTTNKHPESQSCTPQIIKSKLLGPFKIKITGLGDCSSKTNQALDLLRNKAKNNYDTITKYIGIIECTEAQSGMYVWENPPRYQAGKATVDAGTIWYAGTIVHDACHSKQYHDYLFKNPSINVPMEIYTGKNAEFECLDIQSDALLKIGATQETLDYLTTVKDSEYWNIDYNKRWW